MFVSRPPKVDYQWIPSSFAFRFERLTERASLPLPVVFRQRGRGEQGGFRSPFVTRCPGESDASRPLEVLSPWYHTGWIGANPGDFHIELPPQIPKWGASPLPELLERSLYVTS